jgi:excisionase family DNA binding protein
MSEEMYSVEQVADRLGLHVRTIRSYVRDGRLKANKIGKQYRIAASDLQALTGHAPYPGPVRRERHSEVSSIVEIDAISPETVSRVTNLLLAAGNSRGQHEEPLRIETIYDAERARLKVILVGAIDTTASMLKVIKVVLES